MPDLEIPVGNTWDVPGRELSAYVDPTLRAVTRGTITVERERDVARKGTPHAKLRVREGILDLDDTDRSTRRVGRFVPRGQLYFSLADRFVTEAVLEGDIAFEAVSQDHILFETSFRTKPVLRVQYTCRIE
jgi:hypothetical protein